MAGIYVTEIAGVAAGTSRPSRTRVWERKRPYESIETDSRNIRGKSYAQIGYVSENQEIPEWMKVGSLLEYLRDFYPTWDSELPTVRLQDLAERATLVDEWTNGRTTG